VRSKSAASPWLRERDPTRGSSRRWQPCCRRASGGVAAHQPSGIACESVDRLGFRFHGCSLVISGRGSRSLPGGKAEQGRQADDPVGSGVARRDHVLPLRATRPRDSHRHLHRSSGQSNDPPQLGRFSPLHRPAPLTGHRELEVHCQGAATRFDRMLDLLRDFRIHGPGAWLLARPRQEQRPLTSLTPPLP
jgi:hypothetical protein